MRCSTKLGGMARGRELMSGRAVREGDTPRHQRQKWWGRCWLVGLPSVSAGPCKESRCALQRTGTLLRLWQHPKLRWWCLLQPFWRTGAPLLEDLHLSLAGLNTTCFPRNHPGHQGLPASLFTDVVTAWAVDMHLAAKQPAQGCSLCRRNNSIRWPDLSWSLDRAATEVCTTIDGRRAYCSSITRACLHQQAVCQACVTPSTAGRGWAHQQVPLPPITTTCRCHLLTS